MLKYTTSRSRRKNTVTGGQCCINNSPIIATVPPAVTANHAPSGGGAVGCKHSLSNIIRTRLGGCLIVPGILLFIDGRQPICFRKASLSQPSNPRRSEISEVWGCAKARRRFADGLCALQKAATQHWGVPTPQKRVRIMLLRLSEEINLYHRRKGRVIPMGHAAAISP